MLLWFTKDLGSSWNRLPRAVYPILSTLAVLSQQLLWFFPLLVSLQLLLCMLVYLLFRNHTACIVIEKRPLFQYWSSGVLVIQFDHLSWLDGTHAIEMVSNFTCRDTNASGSAREGLAVPWWKPWRSFSDRESYPCDSLSPCRRRTSQQHWGRTRQRIGMAM